MGTNRGLQFDHHNWDTIKTETKEYNEDAFPIFEEFIGLFLRTQRWLEEPFMVDDAVIKLKRKMHEHRIAERQREILDEQAATVERALDEQRAREADDLVAEIGRGAVV